MNEQKKRKKKKETIKVYDLPNAETKAKNFRNNWSFFMVSIKLSL